MSEVKVVNEEKIVADYAETAIDVMAVVKGGLYGESCGIFEREEWIASVERAVNAVINHARAAGRSEGVASERKRVCEWLNGLTPYDRSVYDEIADRIESGEHVGGGA